MTAAGVTTAPERAAPAKVRVLSLSCVYPTDLEPLRGGFVRARLMALAEHVDLRVLAPVGIVQWGARGAIRWGGKNPRRRIDAGVAVLHPRWACLPAVTAFDGLLLFVQLLPLLARIRRRDPWGILDAHWAQPAGVAAWLLGWFFRSPFVVTLRGAETVLARRPLQRWVMARSLPRAARVIAVSADLRDLAVGLGVARERIVLVANGVDFAVFHPVSQSDARARLGLDPHRPIVLSAGRLVVDKGHHDVLEAAGRLLGEHPDLLLVIAGGADREGGECERELRRRAEAPELRDRVRLTGEVTQEALALWMNAADVLCLASRREGCPNVVLEALACGLPVVANAVGAIPELLSTEEVGLLVPPGDGRALEQALRRALGKPWDREVVRRRAGVRSWEEVAVELREVFREAAGDFGENRK